MFSLFLRNHVFNIEKNRLLRFLMLAILSIICTFAVKYIQGVQIFHHGMKFDTAIFVYDIKKNQHFNFPTLLFPRVVLFFVYLPFVHACMWTELICFRSLKIKIYLKRKRSKNYFAVNNSVHEKIWISKSI